MILLIDDDPDWLSAAARLLRGAGFDVLEAATGQAGLALARTSRPDMVLLDVVLPDMNGIEVCRQLKADPLLARTFVILISATQTTSDDQAAGLESGGDRYIARPVSNREFLARVLALRRIQEAEAERDRLRAELGRTLAEVNALRRLIPICAWCKRVRDDAGYWTQIESYLATHSDASFSHAMCPACTAKSLQE